MNSRKHLEIGILAAAVGALAACSGGSSGTNDGSGTISISLMDAPIDDVREVNVRIAAIWLKTVEEGPPFELPLADGPITLDLLEHTVDNAAVLIEGALIPAGAYEWLALDVDAQPNVEDSWVVTHWGTTHEIFLPSNRLRLVEGFEVAQNEAVRLLFDWDMREGLVLPPGLGGAYLLKPAFRVIDVTEYGVLHGTIPLASVMSDAGCDADVDPAQPAPVPADVGNVVYVFAGHDVVPDDFDTIDGDDAEPFTSVDAVPNAAGDYEYKTLLPFGEYTVAFSCQAGNDDPEEDNTDSVDAPVTFWSTVENLVVGNPPAGELDIEVSF